MKARDYSIAVSHLLTTSNSTDDVLQRLKTLLSEHKRTKLYPAIMRDVIKQLKKRDQDLKTRLIVARESDTIRHQRTIVEAEKLLGTSHSNIEVYSHITGGFILETKYARIDASYKKRLLTIYRSLTTHTS
jgi:F0F1-type ATP synthase delta subunit